MFPRGNDLRLRGNEAFPAAGEVFPRGNETLTCVCMI